MSRTVPEFVAPLVPSVVPADTLNKKDLYAHLQEFHGQHVGYYHGVTSKSGKDAMENLHARLHETIDYTQASRALMEMTYDNGGTGSVWIDNPVQPEAGNRFADGHSDKVHEHLVVPTGPATPDERETLDAVTSGSLGRVLSVTERKALERLIDNDFATLRNEMHAYAKEVLETRLQTVTEEFADKQKEADKIAKAAAKAITDARDKFLKQIEDAKAAGITLSLPQNATNYLVAENVKAVVAGQTEAEKKVRAENQSDLQGALHALERQRLASQRLVLLAGISPEGQKLLDTIPDAKALMIGAASERATKQITA